MDTIETYVTERLTELAESCNESFEDIQRQYNMFVVVRKEKRGISNGGGIDYYARK